MSFTVGGKYKYEGTIDAMDHVTMVRTWIDNPVLGDTPVEFAYSDYKDFGGVMFPGRIVRTQGGHPVLDITVSNVTANAPADFAAPAEASAAAPPVNVTVEKLANGVYYLKGGTHHSLAIDQADHIVIVEGPQNEARSLAVIAKAKETIPNKPIRYLINTHAHFDHSGGLRTYVDEGATIVTHQMNQAYYEQAWAAPRTINPDRLAQSKKPPMFQTFTDKLVLTDGKRSIEVHQIAGGGHNDAFAMVYLPAEKILSEGDAFTPLAANAPPPRVGEPVLGEPRREHRPAQAGRAADCGAARAAAGDAGGSQGVHHPAQGGRRLAPFLHGFPQGRRGHALAGPVFGRCDMKSVFHQADRLALARRLDAITSASTPRWGRMDSRQMLAHLSDGVRMALGELAVQPRGGPLRFPPLRHAIIYWLPFPKGAPTAPELLARRAEDCDAERAALKHLLERLGRPGRRPRVARASRLRPPGLARLGRAGPQARRPSPAPVRRVAN